MNCIYMKSISYLHMTQTILTIKILVVALSYVQLWESMDCSPTGSSVSGIFQARILEWFAISSSRGSSQPRDQT